MSPYSSDAQRRLFHSKGRPKGISKADVAEYDQASKGKDLPERVKPKKDRHPQLPANRGRKP